MGRSSLHDQTLGEHTSLKDSEKNGVPTYDATSLSDDDLPEKDVQHGVQAAQAITTIWGKRSLAAAYAMIWMILFINSFQLNITSQLTQFAFSEFQTAPLVPVTNVLSSIIGGLTRLPVAKVLDIWGRAQGFALMVFSCTIGLIMMAACKNVETYCAAQIFYWIGFDGILYVCTVFIADTSSLKSRALGVAFTTSPYIITTFIGGPAAQGFLSGAGWRWGYGTFAIVVPVVSSPLIFMFLYYYRKAESAGLITHQSSNRTFFESIKYYTIEFDGKLDLLIQDPLLTCLVGGILLLIAGLAIFLLPFSLYSFQPAGWQSPLFISMVTIGALLIIAFALYEKYVAPKTFVPFSLLTDRTVLGSYCLAAVVFIAFYCWDAYLYPYLLVVHGLTITEASYVSSIYTVGSSFWALVVGVAIRLSGRFKWVALYFGAPLYVLGVGLMIYFRGYGFPVGFVVMCQIFIAFAGGTLVICWQTAAMAASKHENIATILAVENMFANIGGAIGSTISAAIWTSTFPGALQRYLPAEALPDASTIYLSLSAQLQYELGSPVRNGISLAYDEGQKWMLTAGTIVAAFGIVCVAIWRDIRLKDFKQTKGTVI